VSQIRHRTAGVLAGGLAVALSSAAVADTNDVYTTTLLSRGATGAPGNGPSAHAVISRDNRIAQVAAFDSAADNLVPGDSNAQSDVFAVNRQAGYGVDGTPWSPGPVRLISHGLNGAPANGPSTLPALSGDSRNQPKCIAFLSAASNLVAGDTNAKVDGFVADLASGKISRVSVGSGGVQSNGTTTAISVDGRCRRVAFVADATNLAAAKGKTPSAKALQTTKEPAGSRQVYARGIGGTAGLDRDLTGVTWVVSRSAAGKPSNGQAGGVQISENEQAVVFDTTATNLPGPDSNGQRDVYEAAMTRKYLPKAKGHSPQTASVAVKLVSQNAAGAGNGPSFNPALNNDGTRVAFTTGAASLVPGATGAVTQIAWADSTKTPPDLALASRTHRGSEPGNGPSDHASMTDAGTWIAYDTAATNLPAEAFMGGAAPGRSMMLWMQADNSGWLISDGDNDLPLAGDSVAGMTSPHGNYLVFANGGQVQLRYLGPK
jgi:hypothetical protein